MVDQCTMVLWVPGSNLVETVLCLEIILFWGCFCISKSLRPAVSKLELNINSLMVKKVKFLMMPLNEEITNSKFEQ